MKSTSYPLLIFLLAVGSFVTGTSEFVVSGILDIISDDLHISIPVAGQLITIYSLFYAVGALFLVMATSKLNRKKVLLSAISMFIAGNVLAFFSHHFMLLMLSRVIMAMSGGLYIVLATNYAAQLAPPEKKGSAMATVITGFTVSLVLGVPIGTFLAGYVDWHAIFLIIAIGTACLLFLLYRLLPPMEGHSYVPFKQQMQILQDRRVLSGLATTAFWILGYTMVFAYISPLLRQTSGFTLELTSIALLVLGISAFIGSRFGGYAVDQWGPNRTISISITVQMLMLFALSFTQFSVVGVFITLAIWGTATWTTTPAKQFYLISLKPETSETVLSFNTAIMNIGMMLGSSMGGLIIQYTNVTNLSWIGGLASFVALMLIRYSFNQLVQKQTKSEHV
ncbi:MFS transporter [Bacillus altitudinis]|uniref:MFS transporter n=1 Tax=Bacillus altitudinis TaxID=293387 RepID=UPI00030263D1|nr:MFS transporter [Bacillus altitudinis]QKL20695.1 MFS transporter [Bacillus altitudinis]QKL24424.1 MFS transporter [Bacillus altitudinis]QXY94819.1 MFS transporter [Bacillus altitudinis]